MNREQDAVKRTVIEKLEESIFHFTCLIETMEHLIETKDMEIARLEQMLTRLQ